MGSNPSTEVFAGSGVMLPGFEAKSLGATKPAMKTVKSAGLLTGRASTSARSRGPSEADSLRMYTRTRTHLESCESRGSRPGADATGPAGTGGVQRGVLARPNPARTSKRYPGKRFPDPSRPEGRCRSHERVEKTAGSRCPIRPATTRCGLVRPRAVVHAPLAPRRGWEFSARAGVRVPRAPRTAELLSALSQWLTSGFTIGCAVSRRGFFLMDTKSIDGLNLVSPDRLLATC